MLVHAGAQANRHLSTPLKRLLIGTANRAKTSSPAFSTTAKALSLFPTTGLIHGSTATSIDQAVVTTLHRLFVWWRSDSGWQAGRRR